MFDPWRIHVHSVTAYFRTAVLSGVTLIKLQVINSIDKIFTVSSREHTLDLLSASSGSIHWTIVGTETPGVYLLSEVKGSL